MRHAPKIGVVNFHPAFLPSCRGLFRILFSYLYNEQKYGLSAHWMINTDIDAGRLIAQCEVE
jgi:methionyl-tRNA formyltransferase